MNLYELTSLTARILLGPGVNAAMQKANYPEMKHSQLSYYNSRSSINNVAVKNIKSAGCTCLTRFQQKLLQDLDDIYVETNILLENITQDHIFPSFFSRVITKCFAWSGLTNKICIDMTFRFLNIFRNNAKDSCYQGRTVKTYQSS